MTIAATVLCLDYPRLYNGISTSLPLLTTRPTIMLYHPFCNLKLTLRFFFFLSSDTLEISLDAFSLYLVDVFTDVDAHHLDPFNERAPCTNHSSRVTIAQRSPPAPHPPSGELREAMLTY